MKLIVYLDDKGLGFVDQPDQERDRIIEINYDGQATTSQTAADVGVFVRYNN